MKTRRFDLSDGHVYVGGALLAVGAGLAWIPAGIMVAGLILLLLGVAASWPRREPS